MKNKINVSCEWNRPYRKSKKSGLVSMVNVSALKSENEKNEKRKPINVAFVIDVSTSMNQDGNGLLNGYGNVNAFMNGFNDIFKREENKVRDPFWVKDNNKAIENVNKILGSVKNSNLKILDNRRSLLDKVIIATISSISELKEDDIFSISTFSSDAKIVFPAKKATDKVKEEAYSVLLKLRASGNTAMYKGWEKGVESISDYVSNDYNNRVILLTDGHTNADNINVETFCEIVKEMSKRGNISTSTFGIGSGFNENVLIRLAMQGDGNSYFLDENTHYGELFNRELKELTNVIGKNVNLTIKGKRMDNIILLNDFEKVDGSYVLPNITTLNDISFLIEGDAIGKDASIEITLHYKDSNNNLCIYMQNLSVDISNVDYVNEKVENAMAVLNIAKMQKSMAEEIRMGKIDEAKNILRNARSLTKYIKGEDGNKLIATLNRTEETLERGDISLASKSATYGYYSTNYSR